MQKLIDIHCHIIPDFDDGPGDFDQSIEMLRQAEEQGISDIFATSHFESVISRQLEKEYFHKLSELRQFTNNENININLHSGAEIFFHHGLEKTVRKNAVATLGNKGKYILVEFPLYQIPEGVPEVLFRLSAGNYIPIISHAERYGHIIENPSRISEFIKYGSLIQLNGGSLLGLFGKEIQKTALRLLEWKFVHFISSDAHAPKGRNFTLRRTYQLLNNELDELYLEELFHSNPLQIIQNQPLEKIAIPDDFGKTGIVDRIKRKLKISL